MPLDIYILADEKETFAPKWGTFLENVFTANSRAPSDTSFGVGYYTASEDNCPGQGFRNVQSLTTNTAQVFDALVSQRFTTTTKEFGSNLLALRTLASDPSIGWRKVSHRFVFYFGNLVGQEPICSDGNVVTREDVSDDLLMQNIRVIPIDMGSLNIPGDNYGCGDSSKTKPQQAVDIARLTNGLIVGESEDLDLIEVIDSLVNA